MNTRIVAFGLMLAVGISGVYAGNGRNGSGPSAADTTGAMLQGIAIEELDRAEREGLLLMREEEKLARDVYETLDATWDLRVFSNIANSEQTHMNSMAELLNRYELDDPIVSDRTGAFTDETLKTLYGELTDTGTESVVEALKVGALIEELDIADLKRLISETDNDDITLVYENLLAGSENHLRAFLSQLDRYGAVYQPSYLSEAEIEQIVNDMDSRGSQSPSRGRRG